MTYKHTAERQRGTLRRQALGLLQTTRPNECDCGRRTGPEGKAEFDDLSFFFFSGGV